MSPSRDEGDQGVVLDTETGEPLALPDLGAGDLQSVRFSRSETKMLFFWNSDTSPSNIYSLDLEHGAPDQEHGGEPVRLTNSLSAAIAREYLVEGEVIRDASFDGLEIPGILYRPHSASAANAVSAILSMHGGPGGQSRKGYGASVQHLVNHGYAASRVRRQRPQWRLRKAGQPSR